MSGTGDLDRAVAVVEPLVEDSGLPGPSAFDLAVLCIRAAEAAKAHASTSAKDRETLVDRRIQQGLRLLQRAFDAGYFANASNRNKLQAPPFVTLLATNAAYRKLLEAVEKGPPLKGPGRAK